MYLKGYADGRKVYQFIREMRGKGGDGRALGYGRK